MMDTIFISPKSTVAELLRRWPQVVPVFIKNRMSCVGCNMSAFETLEDAAKIYGIELEKLIEDLKKMAGHAAASAGHSPDFEELIANQPTLQREQEMTTPYTYFPGIAETIDSIPTDSIVSRTIYRDDELKAIVFAFAPGQELSEHTASMPAIIQILEGECDLTLGTDHFSASAGAWARMPANLPHSVFARTPVKMLLLMLP